MCNDCLGAVNGTKRKTNKSHSSKNNEPLSNDFMHQTNLMTTCLHTTKLTTVHSRGNVASYV